MSARELPLPPFYDPANAARWEHAPDQQALSAFAARWRRAHGLRPAGEDRFDLHLLLIDEQKDFCFPSGALYVAGRSGTGALDDNRRVAEFIHRNLGAITRVTATLDTHHPHQIFFPAFWLDRDGAPLAAHREVTRDDVASGRARPDPALARSIAGGDAAWLVRQAEHYCAELERAGRYRLYLWPPHCLAGSDGHALVGVVHEARLLHAWARVAESRVVTKGEHPLTENYSVLRPEVLTRHDGPPLAARDDGLAARLLAADALVVAGQASSHCVKATVDDLLDEIRARDPALARKVYLLTDCMSAVTVPDGKGGLAADFTHEAEAALARWAEAGMHLVRSTDPIAGWPGLALG
jgi:nicotinamidase-related amidase